MKELYSLSQMQWIVCRDAENKVVVLPFILDEKSKKYFDVLNGKVSGCDEKSTFVRGMLQTHLACGSNVRKVKIMSTSELNTVLNTKRTLDDFLESGNLLHISSEMSVMQIKKFLSKANHLLNDKKQQAKQTELSL